MTFKQGVVYVGLSAWLVLSLGGQIELSNRLAGDRVAGLDARVRLPLSPVGRGGAAVPR